MNPLRVVCIVLPTLLLTGWWPAGATVPSSERERLQALLARVVPHVQVSCGGVTVLPTLLLTARHCVRQPEVRLDWPEGSEVGQVECLTAVERDAALVRLQGRRVVGGLVDLAALTVGDRVLVAGWPRGVFVVTEGLVVQRAEHVEVSDWHVVLPVLYEVAYAAWTVPWGFSGGPVWDARGRLRGIVCCGNAARRMLGVLPLSDQVVSCPLG